MLDIDTTGFDGYEANNMDIKEIKQKKRELEQAIYALTEMFNHETDVDVREIKVILVKDRTIGLHRERYILAGIDAVVLI